MARDLRSAVERMAARMDDHWRRQHRTDVTPEQRAEHRTKVEDLARKFEIKNNNNGGR